MRRALLKKQMPALYELHTHLYASLGIEDLYWLAKRKKPRWEIFTRSYFSLYKKEPCINGLFANTEESQVRLHSYFHFQGKTGFRAFQTCFDFLIALSHIDIEEIIEVCLRAVQKEKAEYAEYRMMFPASLSSAEFCEKSAAFCKGLFLAEKKTSPKKKLRAVLSLSRENTLAFKQYEAIQNLLEKNELVRKFLVGIDFCHQEEGHPPKGKEAFFRKVLKDNRKNPDRALAVLYHVGESYTDKSVESAARWVVEAAWMGVHRLGHAVALGVSPQLYLGKELKECPEERLAQIAFEKKHADSLQAAGFEVHIEKLAEEEKSIQEKPHSWIVHYYDEKRIKKLRIFQDWAMEQVKKTKAVIECCPSSNLAVCGLGSPVHHPLLRFLKKGLPLVIGADDPGILDTNLQKEYERISQWPGITKDMLKKLQENALRSTSPILSGRSHEPLESA